MTRGEMLEDIHTRIHEHAQLEQLSDAGLRAILWQFMLNDEWRDHARTLSGSR
jgi:hypothetical protein